MSGVHTSDACEVMPVTLSLSTSLLFLSIISDPVFIFPFTLLSSSCMLDTVSHYVCARQDINTKVQDALAAQASILHSFAPAALDSAL